MSQKKIHPLRFGNSQRVYLIIENHFMEKCLVLFNNKISKLNEKK